MDIELHIPDFKLAKEFYGNLGFSVVWEREPEGEKGYLVMNREGSTFCFWGGNEEIFSQAYFKQFPHNTPRGYGVEMVIPVSHVEALYLQAKELGYVHEDLQTKPWGLKDFRVVDPFGYYLRFTEPHDIRDKKFAIP